MDFIDIPELQRRGLLKKRFEAESEDETGYVNLSSASVPSHATGSESVNPLAFLDGLAGADSSSDLATGVSSEMSGSDIQDLKVKIEDFEYKVDRLSDKLALIESKLREFEGKVG
ncbi:MAG: hypothetical protein ABIG28_02025 [archaeon]